MAEGTGLVRYASFAPLDQAMKLNEYVERLVGSEYTENVVKSFLMTYRDYAAAPALLLILSRLYQNVNVHIRRNIVSLVVTWLSTLWTDFSEDADAAQCLAETVVSFVDFDDNAHDLSVLLSKRLVEARAALVRVCANEEEELVSVGNATISYSSKRPTGMAEDRWELTKKLFTDPTKGISFSMKPYRKDMHWAFTGSAAVDWLLHNKIAKNREEGLYYGRKLWGEGLISHVNNDHIFKDEPHLYHFPNRPVPPEAQLLRRGNAPGSPRRDTNRIGPMSALDFEPSELAKQLTLLDLDLFISVHPSELLGSAWTKATKNALAPHVVANITHFNKLGWWVLTEILSNREKANRVKAVAHFIRTAEALLKLRNYNAALAIVVSLNSHLVRNLREESELPQKLLKTIESLRKTLDLHAIKDPRHPMRVSPPNIPYLGVFLTEIVTIEESHQRTVGDLINFRRYHLLGQVLLELAAHKTYAFDATPLPEFFDYWKAATILSEKALEELSTSLKAAKRPTMGLTRTNTQTEGYNALTSSNSSVSTKSATSSAASSPSPSRSTSMWNLATMNSPDKSEVVRDEAEKSTSLNLLLALPRGDPAPLTQSASSPALNAGLDFKIPPAAYASQPNSLSSSNSSLTGSASSVKPLELSASQQLMRSSPSERIQQELLTALDKQKRTISKLEKKLTREKLALHAARQELEAKDREIAQLKAELAATLKP